MRWYCLNVTGTNLIALTKIQMDLLELLVNFYCFFFKQETHCNYFKGLCIVQISFHRFFLITLKHSALKIRPHHRRHCWELMKTHPARSRLRPLRLPLFVLLQMGRRSNKPSTLAGNLNQLLLQEVVNSGLKVSMKITNWKWAFVKCFNINMLCCGGSSCRHKM